MPAPVGGVLPFVRTPGASLVGVRTGHEAEAQTAPEGLHDVVGRIRALEGPIPGPVALGAAVHGPQLDQPLHLRDHAGEVGPGHPRIQGVGGVMADDQGVGEQQGLVQLLGSVVARVVRVQAGLVSAEIVDDLVAVAAVLPLVGQESDELSRLVVTLGHVLGHGPGFVVVPSVALGRDREEVEAPVLPGPAVDLFAVPFGLAEQVMGVEVPEVQLQPLGGHAGIRGSDHPRGNPGRGLQRSRQA